MGIFDAQERWSEEKKMSRIGDIREELLKRPLTTLDDAVTVKLLDEVIVLMLSLLRDAVIGEGESPLEWFIPVFQARAMTDKVDKNPLWVVLFERFEDTYNLVVRFKRTSVNGKNRLLPQMQARGMV